LLNFVLYLGHGASIASLQLDQSLGLLLTASLDKVIKVVTCLKKNEKKRTEMK
jgi:hypothetical protein